jgi:PAS domain S-box-containing protein
MQKGPDAAVQPKVYATPVPAPPADRPSAPAPQWRTVRGKNDRLAPEPLLRIWGWITDPWNVSARPEDRRRVQMLAGLVLVLLTSAFALMFIIPLVGNPGQTLRDKGLIVANLTMLAIGFTIYLISRTRYYELGAWLMVFGTMAWVSVGVAAAEGTAWATSAPFYLALTVVLSTVLLPLMATLFVAALNLGLLLAFYRLLPGFGVIELSNSMMFLAIASTVLVVTALVRYFDILQIEEQSADIQESEERYRSLFEASFEGLALHENGKILEANQTLADMFRMSREELVGSPILDMLAKNSGEDVLFFSPEGGDPAAREAMAVRSDGSSFPVESISKPYLFQGRHVQVTGVRDITERKEMEKAREKTRELESRNRRLVEVDRMRTRFLNVASHELNTPITPLRMQVHLLKTQGLGDLNDRQLNAVRILERNLVRLSVLVKDILDVSKIEAGRLRLRLSQAEIIQIIEDTVDTFDQVANDRGVRLFKRIEGETWLHVDSDRIVQVVTNLLSNALKFTNEGGRVIVEAKERPGALLVCVQDDGIGLTPDQAERLFRPFEQAHDMMEMTEAGSGLGLYISKGIIEAHGGQMGIDCAGAGKGVRVWFTLPLQGPPPVRQQIVRDPEDAARALGA